MAWNVFLRGLLRTCDLPLNLGGWRSIKKEDEEWIKIKKNGKEPFRCRNSQILVVDPKNNVPDFQILQVVMSHFAIPQAISIQFSWDTIKATWCKKSTATPVVGAELDGRVWTNSGTVCGHCYRTPRLVRFLLLLCRKWAMKIHQV